MNRHWGSQWRLVEDPTRRGDVVAAITLGTATIFPLRNVHKRLTLGPELNVNLFYHTIRDAALAKTRQPE